MQDGLSAQAAIGAVGSSALFGSVVPLVPLSPPENHLLFLGVESPYPQPAVGGTHDGSHALCLRIQSWMPQHTTHKDGHLLWYHLKGDNPIPPVADLTSIETAITREECRTTPLMQEREDFLILEPFAGDVDTDLSHRNPPTLQALPLTCDDIFVQDIHDTVEATTDTPLDPRR